MENGQLNGKMVYVRGLEGLGFWGFYWTVLCETTKYGFKEKLRAQGSGLLQSLGGRRVLS